MSHATIGIDVGATKIRAGLILPDGSIGADDTLRMTPDVNRSGIVAPLVDMIAAFRQKDPDVKAVGVGTAGVVKWPAGEVAFAANHGHWLKLRARLHEQCKLDVVVDNDANAAVLSQEPRYRGEAVLFLALGTGLGSGFLIDGEVVRGRDGRGAELGHVVVDPGRGLRCTCGATGCLETVASGRALVRAGRAVLAAEPAGALARHLGDLPVSMRSMIDASRVGVPEVNAIVKEIGRHIGWAVGRYVQSLFPVDRVVVGGGLSALGEVLTTPIRTSCERAVVGSRFLSAPEVSLAREPADAIMIGAGLLAHRQLAAPVAQGRS